MVAVVELSEKTCICPQTHGLPGLQARGEGVSQGCSLPTALHGLEGVRAAASGHSALATCQPLWGSRTVVVWDGPRSRGPVRCLHSCSILGDCPCPPSPAPLAVWLFPNFLGRRSQLMGQGPGFCEQPLTGAPCLGLWLTDTVHSRIPAESQGGRCCGSRPGPAASPALLSPERAPTEVLPGVTLQAACPGMNATGSSVQPGPRTVP